MAIKIALHHKTHYQFDRLVQLGPHEIRLRPAAHCRTPISAYSLKVSPFPHFVNWQQDPYGNYLARYVFPKPARELLVEVDLVADMTVINPFDFFVEPYAEKFPFSYPASLLKELAPFLEAESAGPLFQQWLINFQSRHLQQDSYVTDFLVMLNQQVQQAVQYIIRMEPGIQTCEQTLERRQGSCRDSAWLVVQLLRHLGIAARFVSGYLVQLAADIAPVSGPPGPKEDFTDLHAWAEAFIPGAGWIGLDATSGLLAGEGHIPLACTAFPSSAAAVIGKTDVCHSTLDFSMTVTRMHEDPRVTKPFTDQQWNEINTLGEQIDQQLTKTDVRLTMGGEPTFVSIRDMEGPEWNFTALSPTKRHLAGKLLSRLHHRWAPGGLLQRGQGKWYPGEPLPRWLLGCYWREDGIPFWKDVQWLAHDEDSCALTIKHALQFLQTVARVLNIHPNYILPAYEDPWPPVLEEQQLPENIDPLERDLRNPDERSTLARLLDRGLGEIVGYVLPLTPQKDARTRQTIRWKSNRWQFRRGHLFLVPGDSPLGLRLPLRSLPWMDPAECDIDPELDPLEERASLGSDPRAVLRSNDESSEEDSPAGEKTKIIHTALCTEIRDSRLMVFLPPLSHLEDFLELVACVEEAAKTSQTPIALEGYPPPGDPRLRALTITPDPGVIEVNVPPARSWHELVSMTTSLYEEARLTELGTEKFMLDGRHTGTGGGNHITIGGPTPADSPLLRRPDLLKSLLLYWQNHPALSYVFAGQFVGPTSQAPRIDEAQWESLYELDIALQQLADHGPDGTKSPLPWIGDRILRHLLVDVTGNTHRAEFCIDKLYTPDRASGRLGLLELRAFEMPPHPQMALLQMLLVRTLVARFWRTPYEGKLIRWGTDLHDRFMLPHCLAEDLRDIVVELRAAGYPYRCEWFEPFLEFRFPRYGTIVHDGMELELRQAIEPWPVLGEAVQGTGTSRAVDSSVERLQVKVTNFIESRYLVACNGRRVPLRPTGTKGEFIAGIRFRAWQPPSCLHPTIPVHTPLVFDIVDTRHNRSIGGCTYHVSHPGGRNYKTFPVNANEAEARRHARFWDHGHTPGPLSIPPESPSPDFPFTLDLRRQPRVI